MESNAKKYNVETDAKPFKVNKDSLVGCMVRSIDVVHSVTDNKYYMRTAAIKLDGAGFIQEYHLVVQINKKTFDSMSKK